MNTATEKANTSDEASWNLEQFVTYKIARLNAQLNQQATRQLGEISDLTLGQWRVLAAIGAGKARTSRKVHDVTKLDPGLISRLLRQLEVAKQIKTQRSKEDRRVVNIALTSKGVDTFTTVFPIMAKRQEAFLENFSEQEFHSLHVLLERLQDSISDTTIKPG